METDDDQTNFAMDNSEAASPEIIDDNDGNQSDSFSKELENMSPVREEDLDSFSEELEELTRSNKNTANPMKEMLSAFQLPAGLKIKGRRPSSVLDFTLASIDEVGE